MSRRISLISPFKEVDGTTPSSTMPRPKTRLGLTSATLPQRSVLRISSPGISLSRYYNCLSFLRFLSVRHPFTFFSRNEKLSPSYHIFTWSELLFKCSLLGTIAVLFGPRLRPIFQIELRRERTETISTATVVEFRSLSCGDIVLDEILLEQYARKLERQSFEWVICETL